MLLINLLESTTFLNKLKRRHRLKPTQNTFECIEILRARIENLQKALDKSAKRNRESDAPLTKKQKKMLITRKRYDLSTEEYEAIEELDSDYQGGSSEESEEEYQQAQGWP